MSDTISIKKPEKSYQEFLSGLSDLELADNVITGMFLTTFSLRETMNKLEYDNTIRAIGTFKKLIDAEKLQEGR